MSVKDYLNLSYGIIAILAIAVYWGTKIYNQKHQIKNNWLLELANLAAAFVQKAEQTDNDSSKKMDNVITGISAFLASRGIKVDATIESVIRAYAEQAVAEMNSKNSTKKGDKK